MQLEKIENQKDAGIKTTPKTPEHPWELNKEDASFFERKFKALGYFKNQLDVAKGQTAELSQRNMTTLDGRIQEMGINSPEETNEVKQIIDSFNRQKQKAIQSGQEEMGNVAEHNTDTKNSDLQKVEENPDPEILKEADINKDLQSEVDKKVERVEDSNNFRESGGRISMVSIVLNNVRDIREEAMKSGNMKVVQRMDELEQALLETARKLGENVNAENSENESKTTESAKAGIGAEEKKSVANNENAESIIEKVVKEYQEYIKENHLKIDELSESLFVRANIEIFGENEQEGNEEIKMNQVMARNTLDNFVNLEIKKSEEQNTENI